MTVVVTHTPSTKSSFPVYQDRTVSEEITVVQTPVPMSPQNIANVNLEIAPVIPELTKIKPKAKHLVRSVTATSNQAAANITHKTWLAPGKLTTERLEQFVTTILPTSVQLDQPFGKDSLKHTFYAAKSFCHILLPLLKSGFLSCKATKA